MAGDSRVRFCGSCKQNVYDVSDLALPDIESLVFAREGRVCLRMLARPDGTMVVNDCRSRIRALRTKGILGWTAFVILILPLTLGTHLLQAVWLWGATCKTVGEATPVVAPAVPQVPIARLSMIMGAPLIGR